MEKSQSVTFSQFTQTQIQKLKDAFQFIDDDGDGLISQQDLNKVFVDLGNQPKEQQLNEMLGEENEGLTFPGFVAVMSERITQLPEEDELVNALQVLSEQNEDLVVKADELRKYLVSAGLTDQKELEKVLQHFTTKQISGDQIFKGKKFLETIGE